MGLEMWRDDPFAECCLPFSSGAQETKLLHIPPVKDRR